MPDVILKILFLTMSNVDTDFQSRDLQWKSYITKDILPTIKQVKLIGKKVSIAAILD